jgi:acyl-CoA thioesterase I
MHMSYRILGLIGAAILIVVILFIWNRNEDTTGACTTQPPLKVVAFGDSLIAGNGATTEGGFVTLLAQGAGIPITNFGRSGDTTEDARKRLPSVVSSSPSITILLLGGNDALRKVPEAQTEENLGYIIAELQKTGSKVILLGVIGGIPDPYGDMYKRLADTYDVTYVPNVLSGLIGRSDFMSDPIHPNQAGYEKIAARILPVLEKECSEE